MNLPFVRAFLLCVALAPGLPGCDSPPAPSSNEATPAESASPTQGVAASPPTTAATPAATEPAALASSEGEIPGLRTEVQELKRTAGDTLTLKLAFVNDGQQDVMLDQFGAGQEVYSLAGVNLVDIVGKKKYFVASDSEGKCLCSRDLGRLAPGARASLWAKFPAPPPDVQQIGIVVPRFAPLEDVPISP
jgi:hypothetical protein